MRVLSFGSPSGRRDQMTFFIGRRHFITLIGGAAAALISARLGVGTSAVLSSSPVTNSEY
jgi:hypothetical protein